MLKLWREKHTVSIPYGEYDLRHTVREYFEMLQGVFPSPTGNMTFVTFPPHEFSAPILQVSIPYGEYDLRHRPDGTIQLNPRFNVSIPYGEYDLRHLTMKDLGEIHAESFHPLRGI